MAERKIYLGIAIVVVVTCLPFLAKYAEIFAIPDWIYFWLMQGGSAIGIATMVFGIYLKISEQSAR